MPARILAKQTGATQFQEERYVNPGNCNGHQHHLKKRASDEDSDYEVYQGVVGRPGIDFPIHPRIKKTSFSCRLYGNGYFADMDTDCQVFHICEEGRKISFLCPNGTIFQQSELTCDWWFKVNCLGSPEYYGDSAEILNKQRLHRVRPSIPVKGFNIVGGGLNIKPKISNIKRRVKEPDTSERRIDSKEHQPIVESIDFEDISGEKLINDKVQNLFPKSDIKSEESEYQITSETTSVTSTKRNINAFDNLNNPGMANHNSHSFDKASKYLYSPKNETKYYSNQPYTDAQSSKGEKNMLRGLERFKDNTKVVYEIKENNKNEEIDTANYGAKNQKPEKLNEYVRLANRKSKSNHLNDEISGQQDANSELNNEHNYGTEKVLSSDFKSDGQKLRKIQNTPLFIPTLPSVSNTKIANGKYFYSAINGNGKVAVTTLKPNRINSYDDTLYISTEASSSSKEISFEENEYNKGDSLSSTHKPFVIGMQHYQDSDIYSREIYNFLVESKNPLKTNDLQLLEIQTNKSRETSFAKKRAPASHAYLPNYGLRAENKANAASNGFHMFSQNKALNESVARNLDGMLKTMSFFKNKLTDVDNAKDSGTSRSGLEIPPSSGPDVLITLAKYFANEQSASNEGSVNVFNQNTLSDIEANKTHNSDAKPNPSKTSVAMPREVMKRSDIKSSLLSERTVDHYTSLFGLYGDNKRKLSQDRLAKTENWFSKTKESYDPFTQIASTDSTVHKFATNLESRKLAKVFSNGLSKYLEDPKNFRQELKSNRPKKPTSDIFGDLAPNFTPITLNDQKPFRSGTAATYLPTKPTPPGNQSTINRNTFLEVNKKFELLTQLPGLSTTADLFKNPTLKPNNVNLIQRHELELSAELSPPSRESVSGEELLNREHTQSFLSLHNELSSTHFKKNSGKAIGAYESHASATENTWTGILQADFLDPLTINDILMKESKSTTANSYTYSSKVTAPQSGKSKARNSSSSHNIASPELKTQPNFYPNSTEAVSWQHILDSYSLPVATLPSSNGLQAIANRLFGGLNESEALHLKNVMQQAEHNRLVLRLLLLLIQSCDDHNGKMLERSRKRLLNALIDMDSKWSDNQRGQNFPQKTFGAFAATETPLEPTKRKIDIPSTVTFSSHATLNDFPATIATTPGKFATTTQFERRVEDPYSDQFSTASTIIGTNSNTSSDKRTLDLLKSLYSLASKFASRR